MVDGPHFEEDKNSDGLADYWDEVGTPVTTINTTNYMVGTQSQQVVTDSNDEGVSHYVGPPLNSELDLDFVAYAWVYLVSGSDVTLEVSGDFGSVTTTYSSATTTATGKGGATWRRLEVTSTLTGGNEDNLLISTYADSGTTFCVDKTIITSGSTIPETWMSGRYFRNYYDDTDTGVNYVDFVDVPGDLPAITKYKVQSSSALMYYMSNRKLPLVRHSYFYFENQGTPGANCSSDEYESTVVGTAFAEIASYTITTPPRNTYRGKYVLFSKLYDEAGTGTVTLKASIKRGSNAPEVESLTVTEGDPSVWLVQQLAILDLSEPMNDNAIYFNQIEIRIYAKRDAGSNNIRVDFSMLVPTGVCIFEQHQVGVATEWAYLSTETQREYTLDAYTNIILDEADMLGDVPELDPLTDNRLFLISSNDSSYWGLGVISYLAQVTIIPRTEFLFGS
jgi:hypothetical protein